MPNYSTLVAAAKAYGAAHGIAGGPGGWLVQQLGSKTVSLNVHGWEDFGVELVRTDHIHVLDRDGCRVDREKTRTGVVVNSYRTWRKEAARFVVPELQDAPQSGPLGLEPGQVPEAVAVDTSWSYVFSAAEDGRPFTLEGAKAFAARRNEGLKVPTYRAFRLTEVTEES